MIDLYLAGTANGLRASVALEEAGLPYRAHKLDLAKGEQRSVEYLKINPAGMIPSLVDSEGPDGRPLTITQSGSIVLYVAQKSGKLLPRSPAAHAQCMQWFMQAASDVAGTSGAIFQLEMRTPEKSTLITEYFKKRLLDFFAHADMNLAGKEFLAGEFSAADVMLYPNFAARKALLDAAGGYENLQRWGATLAARPAVQRGMKAAA
ncbi:MAG: glutathione S-transferase family protein [Betaproteobacteria bacterium]|nr:glutathione S-transferase family protein [Betaproteobacteria bacterium]